MIKLYYETMRVNCNRFAFFCHLQTRMQKPNSVFFSRKTGHDFLPMESTVELEKMCKKYDASQFAFGSHNKKRPNNIVLG